MRPVTRLLRHPVTALQEFLRVESASAIVLMAASAVALLIVNLDGAGWYAGLVAADLSVAGLHVTPQHAINDGLMTLFFLLVGLEIKRELVGGELSSARRIALPGLAALGGMVAPALVYVALNAGGGPALRGWAIPAATDIAFALGVLSLLGPRVPASLKLFLTALAILDDLGAIVIIALFYTAGLSLTALALALGGVVVLALLNARGVDRLWPYLAVGFGVWLCVLQSGVHATLAGVAVALTIPLSTTVGGDRESGPLCRLEHALHPWVAYAIVPLFGFANAGVSFADAGWRALRDPVTLGIAGGLFVGKQVGVGLACWLAIRLRIAEPPAGASPMAIWGVAILCGIGFTMSLFIGLLAFESGQLVAETKLGVLLGSGLSALMGSLLLARAVRG